MKRKLIYIMGVLLALVAVGAGAFYSGTAYAGQQATNTRAAFFAGRGGTGGAAGAGGGANGAGGFGGGVAGVIKSISGETIQVSTAQSVTTVSLSDNTSVLKLDPATAADLQVGQQVTVRGQRDASGDVAATSIQVVPAGTSLGGSGAGPAATPAQ